MIVHQLQTVVFLHVVESQLCSIPHTAISKSRASTNVRRQDIAIPQYGMVPTPQDVVYPDPTHN